MTDQRAAEGVGPYGADGGSPTVSLRGQYALPPLKGEVSTALAPVTEGFGVAIRIPRRGGYQPPADIGV